MIEKRPHVRDYFREDLIKSEKVFVHIVMIATKPDIIKQAPLYLELKNRWELVVLIHTWQHYDYNLSEWVLNEFGMKVDINLNIYWALYKKYSLIEERLGEIFDKISDIWKIPVPYVHWDTLTATSADKAAFLNKFSVVHVEAGIRTFTPKKEFYDKLFTDYEEWIFDFEKYLKKLRDFSIYELGSIEPYPEQFDTRWIEPSTWYYAAPVDLYRKTLINEWYSKENIEVVGNTTTDVVKISMQRIWESKAFEYFPTMKWKPFIFVTIHRRENCEIKERFLAIFYAIKKLLKDWVYVCFLGLNASKQAIERYWLTPKLEKMIKEYKDNFAYGDALAHHHEVMDMISKAWAVVTDSGSMQEEANVVWVPCVTIRFWSDRIETVLEWTNVIAPPVNARLIAEIVENSIWNKNLIWKNIYWENVSKKIVDWVLARLKKQWKLFRFDHERLKLEKFFDWKI